MTNDITIDCSTATLNFIPRYLLLLSGAFQVRLGTLDSRFQLLSPAPMPKTDHHEDDDDDE